MKDNFKQEILWLMSHALGVSSANILARKTFTREEQAKIDALLSRYEAGEPLQYIMGEADFYGRDFYVGPGVLIPRHDTETLIEAVKKYFPSNTEFSFMDWGTGSGCIAITILLEFQKSFAYMIENSYDALKYAHKNLERFNLNERAAFNVLPDKLDLIISNPPYIPSCEIPGLDKTVKDYEPHSALDGGEDGMNFYRLILTQAKSLLKLGGYIILEIGNMNQVQALKNFDDEDEFEFVDEIYDMGNFPRCLVLRRRVD